MSTPETTAPEQEQGRFQPGRSGNPAGRPKGARNKTTLAALAILDGEAEALTRKAVEMALAGDSTALRLCLERLVPPAKELPIPKGAVNLPRLSATGVQTSQTGTDWKDCVSQALASIVEAVATGRLTTSQGDALASLVERYRKACNLDAPMSPEQQETPLDRLAKALSGRRDARKNDDIC